MRQNYFIEKLVSLVKLVTSESGNRKKKVGYFRRRDKVRI